MTILKDYVEAVLGPNGEKAANYREAENYYEGLVPEQFASSNMRKAMRVTGHRGQHNYCRVIVDAVLNRLQIANVIGSTDVSTHAITKVWDDNEMNLEANEIHRRALEYGDCYALVWPDENGDLMISYASPRTTGIVYDPENPRKKLYAVKIWKADTNKVRMNIYKADKIEKYSSKGTDYTAGSQWESIGSEPNPFGEVPVFHFRTHRPYGKPEHLDGYGAQNDINKLLATHFYTIDYQGAPQRYALALSGNDDLLNFDDEDTERDNLDALHSSPGNVWYLKGINSVGQFQPADPDNFWKPISNLKQSLAALTDTPFHYLDRGVSVSSSKAQRVAEAPLLKKVADRQISFGTTWKELFTFVLKVEGIKARLEIQWEDVESFDALDEWDVMLKKINAGLSHRQALREAGYEEKEIERIMTERAQEAAELNYYQRTTDTGTQTLQNNQQARVSTNDNETFANRNGMTEAAQVDGGRGKNTN